MPRPVSSFDPIGVDAAPYHAAILTSPAAAAQPVPPAPSTPPPVLSLSTSASASSASAPSSSSSPSWWQWGEDSSVPAHSKDDLMLNMSVEFAASRRHLGFIDQSMKSDGFVPIDYGDAADSSATAAVTADNAVNADGMQQLASVSAASSSASSLAVPTGDATFQTIASVSSPASLAASAAAAAKAGSSSSSSSAEDSGEFLCPCCGVTTTGGLSYHAHVTQCYMTRFLRPSRSQPSSPRAAAAAASSLSSSPVSPTAAPASPAAAIQSLRECVNQLGLHTRLSMMEAFFRLSRSTASAETAEIPPPFPVEEKLISLLYSPAPQSLYASHQHVASSSPTSSSLSVSSSPPYRYSPDIERPFSPSSYSSHANDALDGSFPPPPHTPAASPPRSPHTPHTCLTPSLHQWEMGDHKDEHSSPFFLHEQQQAFLLSHGAQQLPAAGSSSQQQHGGYPSAPSSPSPAVKRARALSQPAIPYFDDLSAASSSSPQSTLHSASLMSASMRSYSPVQVHPSSHPYFHSTPAAASRSQQLHAPVPVTAGSRRHSTGAHSRLSRANPRSSKNIFHQPSPPSIAPFSSSSSASSSSPHSAEDSGSFSSPSSSSNSASANPASSAPKQRRRRKRKDSQ